MGIHQLTGSTSSFSFELTNSDSLFGRDALLMQYAISYHKSFTSLLHSSTIKISTPVLITFCVANGRGITCIGIWPKGRFENGGWTLDTRDPETFQKEIKSNLMELTVKTTFGLIVNSKNKMFSRSISQILRKPSAFQNLGQLRFKSTTLNELSVCCYIFEDTPNMQIG